MRSVDTGLVMVRAERGDAMSAELWSVLLVALISVESPKTQEQAESAIRREGAYGKLQIRQVCLDDVNSWNLMDKEITLSQCQKSETVSRWVAVRYMTYWGNHYEKETGLKPTFEIYARIWNGGPYGWRKDSTIKYWQKVRDKLWI